MTEPVLRIENLTLEFSARGGTVHALRNVSFDVPHGEILGIVGESGSGKSTLALAIMRLLSQNARIVSGRMLFAGMDLVRADEEKMRELRGARISMVFQDPMTSLNPVRSIGDQMLDIQFRDHSRSLAQKRERAADTLRRVGIPDAAAQLACYPFQLSGGMRQRVAIAMSLLQRPELLIADEVTTALDVTLEAQMLHLLRELRQEVRGAILFISHNLGAIAEICDRVVVLYAGEVVEAGPVESIFNDPRHPYTRALIACDPARIEETTRELPVIPGDVPNLHEIPDACIFSPRCPRVQENCRRMRPDELHVSASHVARCFFAGTATA
jgi:oligopeptide/dipeptide ABC transporter ATP-binding protein